MIKKLKLEGHYDYVHAPNGRGDLTGEIDVSETGLFEGRIIDHASIVSEQNIRGHLKREGNSNKMLFLKFPPHDDLANLLYSLQNESSIPSFGGKYTGEWMALPFKIEFEESYKLFLAKIDPIVCRVRDSAEINVYNK